MSAPTTFHDFSKLPTELKIYIWELAARSQEGCALIQDSAFRSMTSALSQFPVPALMLKFADLGLGVVRWTPRQYQWIPGPDAVTVTSRANMGAACHLSRHVVLQTWKREIEAVTIRESLWRWETVTYGPSTLEDMRQVRRILLELFNKVLQ